MANVILLTMIYPWTSCPTDTWVNPSYPCRPSLKNPSLPTSQSLSNPIGHAYMNDSKNVEEVKWQKAGDESKLNRSSTGSPIIGHKPFYAQINNDNVKSTNEESNSEEKLKSCTMAVSPKTLWDTRYHFNTPMGLSNQSQAYVAVIYNSSIQEGTILLDDSPVTYYKCHRSHDDGYDFKSCYFHVGTGYHSLRLNSSDAFMAYTFGKLTNESFCDPLRLKPTEPTIITIQTTTNAPETSELTAETTATEVLTETTSSVCTDPPLCQTTTLNGNTINHTKTREEVKKQRVNVTRTSSNQRKKTSSPDSGQSSQATGICNALVIGSLVLVIVVPDVTSFLKYHC